MSSSQGEDAATDCGSILADAHVHIHPCFDLDGMFDSAVANFNQAAARFGVAAGQHVLLLTESRWANWFERLRDGSVRGMRRWRMSETGESRSLLAIREDAVALVIGAGNQVVTREGLELLTLGTEARFEDGLPMAESLAQANAAGALCVIPWGFGKWMGRRGEVLDGLLRDASLPAFHLGDNSGRPRFWPRPPAFALAERSGRRVLPGSDPLPFASEVWRAGSAGFRLEIDPDRSRPVGAILEGIAAGAPMQPYGALEGAVKFVRNQLRMQFAKGRP